MIASAGFTGFLKSLFWKTPPGGLVNQRLISPQRAHGFTKGALPSCCRPVASQSRPQDRLRVLSAECQWIPLSGPLGLRPWNVIGSRPFCSLSGSTEARIDCPEMRMCSAVSAGRCRPSGSRRRSTIAVRTRRRSALLARGWTFSGQGGSRASKRLADRDA